MEPGDLVVDYSYKSHTRAANLALILGSAKIGKQEMLYRTLQPDGAVVIVPIGLLRPVVKM